ncbi:hypothetical protein B0H11DRAFT_778943 [Mycena galericulata]|nr:hypothetical protein B0H11DRAFT_778943 [Mycena galericulata]
MPAAASKGTGAGAAKAVSPTYARLRFEALPSLAWAGSRGESGGVAGGGGALDFEISKAVAGAFCSRRSLLSPRCLPSQVQGTKEFAGGIRKSELCIQFFLFASPFLPPASLPSILLSPPFFHPLLRYSLPPSRSSRLLVLFCLPRSPSDLLPLARPHPALTRLLFSCSLPAPSAASPPSLSHPCCCRQVHFQIRDTPRSSRGARSPPRVSVDFNTLRIQQRPKRRRAFIAFAHAATDACRLKVHCVSPMRGTSHGTFKSGSIKQ